MVVRVEEKAVVVRVAVAKAAVVVRAAVVMTAVAAVARAAVARAAVKVGEQVVAVMAAVVRAAAPIAAAPEACAASASAVTQPPNPSPAGQPCATALRPRMRVRQLLNGGRRNVPNVPGAVHDDAQNIHMRILCAKVESKVLASCATRGACPCAPEEAKERRLVPAARKKEVDRRISRGGHGG